MKRAMIKHYAGHYNVIIDGICRARFKHKDDAEKYVGRFRDTSENVIERTLTGRISKPRKSNEPYRYAILSQEFRKEFLLCMRYQFKEEAQDKVDRLNSNPEKHIHRHFQLVTVKTYAND